MKVEGAIILLWILKHGEVCKLLFFSSLTRDPLKKMKINKTAFSAKLVLASAHAHT